MITLLFLGWLDLVTPKTRCTFPLNSLFGLKPQPLWLPALQVSTRSVSLRQTSDNLEPLMYFGQQTNTFNLLERQGTGENQLPQYSEQISFFVLNDSNIDSYLGVPHICWSMADLC